MNCADADPLWDDPHLRSSGEPYLHREWFGYRGFLS